MVRVNTMQQERMVDGAEDDESNKVIRHQEMNEKIVCVLCGDGTSIWNTRRQVDK